MAYANAIRTPIENMLLREMAEEDNEFLARESTEIDDIMDLDSEEDLFDNYNGEIDDYVDDDDEEIDGILEI